MRRLGSSSSWGLMAVIAALALMALALFLSRERVSTTEQQPAPPSNPLPAIPAVAAWSPAAAPAPLADDEVDMCGYGRVKRSESENIESKAHSAADLALSRLTVRLAASPHERDAALGLFLWRSTGSEEVLQDYVRQHPECEEDASCRQSITALSSGQTGTVRDALVRMASATRDPQVYAVALHFCDDKFGSGAQGACTLLSPERWTELEPDNGFPWLLLANATQLTNDRAARDQLVYHASKARHFDAYLPNLLGLLQWPEIRAEAPQTRWAISDELVGMEGTLPNFTYTPFIQYCNGSPTADAAHLGVCGDLANLLLKQDHSLLGFAAGTGLARSAGWPPEVVNALKQDKDELFQATQRPSGGSPESLGADCRNLSRREQWAADYAELGVLGVARKRVEDARKEQIARGSGRPRAATR